MENPLKSSLKEQYEQIELSFTDQKMLSAYFSRFRLSHTFGNYFSTFSLEKRLKILKAFKGFLTQSTLKEISIFFDQFSEDEAQLLGSCFQQTGVRTIELLNIGDRNVSCFIEQLYDTHVSVVKLWTIGSRVNKKTLGESFQNTKVKEIQICSSSLKGTGVCAFFEGLTHNFQVQQFSIAWDDLNNASLEDICRALKGTAITHVKIQSNKLSDPKWLLSFIQWLKETQIVYLDFRGNLSPVPKGKNFLENLQINALKTNLFTLKLSSQWMFTIDPSLKFLNQNIRNNFEWLWVLKSLLLKVQVHQNDKDVKFCTSPKDLPLQCAKEIMSHLPEELNILILNHLFKYYSKHTLLGKTHYSFPMFLQDCRKKGSLAKRIQIRPNDLSQQFSKLKIGSQTSNTPKVEFEKKVQTKLS